MKAKEIEELRKTMGTHPETQPRRSDEIFIGVEKIKVELIDYPRNPYKAIYHIVTSTWGGRNKWWNKWENTSVEGRIMAVQAALSGKTLQQALEAPSFTFKIDGLSRSAFDQLARHRFTAIGSVGMRDNNWLDAALRIPSPMKKYYDEIRNWWIKTKDLYQKLVEEGQASWQNARFILPMGVCWRFTWTMNYRALKDDVLSRRLMFCEQFDTVATAWLIWNELYKKFPLLAVYCQPLCDRLQRCIYHDLYSLSAAFGCLFKPCGRWPPQGPEIYATFPNEAAADIEEIRSQLKIKIPEPNEWNELIEKALELDRKYFEED